ncbi:MAG: hypothetical protein HQL44_15300 [Alphaproteobacteria bacterium]|nr:hypothetical protein [Alphaproteobacteria bacterium]
MIPSRFVVEYPQRCSDLLCMLEADARKADLLGSFSVLVASAAFTIPFSRIVEPKHPLGHHEDRLSKAIKKLKKVPFQRAPFFHEKSQIFFRYALIATNPECTQSWRNSSGVHPIDSTEEKDGNTILRAIRNALAHGNVVYLDKWGHETPGEKLTYLGFISKHESKQGNYRVAIFDGEGFLEFLKGWIKWIASFPAETKFEFQEAAE